MEQTTGDNQNEPEEEVETKAAPHHHHHQHKKLKPLISNYDFRTKVLYSFDSKQIKSKLLAKPLAGTLMAVKDENSCMICKWTAGIVIYEEDKEIYSKKFDENSKKIVLFIFNPTQFLSKVIQKKPELSNIDGLFLIFPPSPSILSSKSN